jgi:hypothetical protein
VIGPRQTVSKIVCVDTNAYMGLFTLRVFDPAQNSAAVFEVIMEQKNKKEEYHEKKKS